MTTAAFFDLDNTVVSGSALFHIGTGLVGRCGLRWGEVTRYGWQHFGYRVRGERADRVADMRERALSLAAGLPVAEIVGLGEQLYDERLAPRVYDGTSRLVAGHLERGNAVWLVTAAPIELAQLVARRLGFTGALGTRAEVRDGAWTGRLVGDVLHGPAKAEAVRTLAASTGIDLGASAAYSDSINDLPLLEAVGRPHTVNPDRRLRQVASKRSWPVHEFRSVRRVVSRRARLARSRPPASPLVA
jgi:HAD superfamily hydrolase (TIGR01490 family)